jgi:hypothetical protein
LDSDWFRYEYQAIVTNNDYLTPEEVFNEYNQRYDIENNIGEIKEGFAFVQNSQQNKKCNELFLLIKMLAYNLQNFSSEASCRIVCISTKLKLSGPCSIEFPAICLVMYRHISFPTDKLLEKLVEYIRHKLKIFRLPQVTA